MSVAFVKKVFAPRVKKWVKKYTRFSVRDGAEHQWATLRVVERKNCAVENGLVRAGLGVRPFTLKDGTPVSNVAKNAEPQTFFWFLDDTNKQRLAGLTKTGTFYIYGTNGWALRAQFTAAMHAFPVRNQSGDFVAFVGGAGYATYFGKSGDLTFYSREAFLPIGCSTQGRVFCATAENEIAYFAAFDVSNVTADGENVGRIRLPSSAGEIVAMVGLNDRVVVFCERGIFIVKVQGNGDDFVIESVLFDGGTIFGKSVSHIKEQGDKIAFLTENGVYLFQNASVKKLDLDMEILPKRVGQVCDQGVADGKYVLAYLDQDGEEKCAVIDVENGNAYACFTVNGFCNVEGTAACVKHLSVCLFSKDGDFPAGQSAEVKFYSDGDVIGKKTLKNITLYGKGKVDMTVASAYATKVFALDLTSGKQTVKIDVQGEDFDVVCQMPTGSELRGCRMEFCKSKGGFLGVVE